MSPASSRHTVVVTDGEQRSALAAVRTLGRAGHRVFVCSAHPRPLAGASRYAGGCAQVPDPLREPDAFVTALAALGRAWGADVILPMTDASMLAALEAVERLAPATLPFVDGRTYRAISDKEALLSAAARLGIAVPAQHTLHAGDLDALEHVRVPFPVVVKPARSVGEHAGKRESHGVRYARDAGELREIVGAASQAAFPLLLQQRIIGPGVGIFLLIWDGEVRGTFAHRRLREKPPSGGVSVYCESIAAKPELVAQSRALLGEFGWRGVAMIEYKMDHASGTPYLMEINGRFWGSLQLAIDAGVDFPNLLLGAALDGERVAAPVYRTGVRSRWWWGDVDQLITRLRQSPEALALPASAPTRWNAWREFWRSGNGADRNEVFRRDDPAPFLRETAQWIRGDCLRGRA